MTLHISIGITAIGNETAADLARVLRDLADGIAGPVGGPTWQDGQAWKKDGVGKYLMRSPEGRTMASAEVRM